MNILLIGSGGREHALAWAIAKSALVDKLYIAPGNAGMVDLGEMVSLDTSDNDVVVSFAKENSIDFVVVGPEAPLVAGLADALEAGGIKVFGPSQKAAQLEGSKGFTKALCDRHNIPTAAYGKFDNAADAKAYVEAQGTPIVIKADGLAAGKGVTVAMTVAEANEAVKACFDGAFGGAGAEVVVEEFLEGEEVSFFALSDGTNILPLTSAQDHKAVGEGDTGPNTGGMGAYSPAPVMTAELEADVMARIIKPTVDGMASEGMPYKGVLFAGLMITSEGPKLIEYNCRFGDPECQVLMLRLKEDIVTLLEATADGVLDRVSARWRDETALTVVLASDGYPGSYKKGTIIADVDAAEATGAHVFHAGTALENGNLIAIGGRVLNVTAIGANATEAQRKAYEAVDKINWPEGFCRRDIGWRAVAREQG